MSLDFQLTLDNPDEGARIAALVQPEFDADQKFEIIAGLSATGLSDPRFLDFMESNPGASDAINPDALLDPACPEQLVSMFLKYSRSSENLIQVLASPRFKKSLEVAFDPEARETEAEATLRAEFETQAGEPEDRELFDKFLKSKLPAFIPRFEPQDSADLSHRVATLIGGVPFTSSKHPWPRCAANIPKQPIIQVNLAEAGRLLGVDLGKGLVQVWANQIDGGWPTSGGWPFNEDDENFELRLIPVASLLDVPANDQPSVAPWQRSIEELEQEQWNGGLNLADHPCLMLHSERRIENPRVSSWVDFGKMYPPRYGSSLDLLGEATFDFTSLFYADFPVDSVLNPDSGFIPNGAYLGGYGGGYGGQNEAYPLKMRDGRLSRLLLNYRSDGDSYTAVTLALHFFMGKKGPKFGFQYYRYA